MATFHRAEELKRALGALPQVASVDEIKVENDIIKHVTLEAESIGKVTVHQLDVNDAAGLFDFYSHGLSESRDGSSPPIRFSTRRRFLQMNWLVE